MVRDEGEKMGDDVRLAVSTVRGARFIFVADACWLAQTAKKRNGDGKKGGRERRPSHTSAVRREMMATRERGKLALCQFYVAG